MACNIGFLGLIPVLGFKNFIQKGQKRFLWGNPKITWDDIMDFFYELLKMSKRCLLYYIYYVLAEIHYSYPIATHSHTSGSHLNKRCTDLKCNLVTFGI